jgi:hypothetical protein
MSIFDDLRSQYSNDGYSSKHTVYWNIYEEIFHKYDLEKKLSIFEIGVDNGTGMNAYHRIFPNAKICGLDIRKIISPIGPVYTGSQDNVSLLKTIHNEQGPFDIVIDDGSHNNDHQITTFECLFPLLKPGGIYIVEDTHSSYWSVKNGGYDSESFVNYTKRLFDLINYWYWTKGYQDHEGKWNPDPNDVDNYNSHNVPLEIYSNINSIRFYPNIVVFHKGNKPWEYQIPLFMS